jgi:hypothetical protein
MSHINDIMSQNIRFEGFEISSPDKRFKFSNSYIRIFVRTVVNVVADREAKVLKCFLGSDLD